jgi:TPR repeat protein
MTENAMQQARAAANRRDFEAAIALLRPLAEAGDREALYELAFLALTECDLVSGREAFALFMAAVEQGHAEAMYHLAQFPEFVSEPFKSPLPAEEAWGWLLRAAEAGSVQAQYSAAASLATGDWADGHVLPVDLKAAVTWYRRAADAGHAEAQFNLAAMLMEGEGCDRNLVAAREWLNRSLAGGYTYAQELLADLDFRSRRE